MGIRHLTTFLRPYSTLEPLAGAQVVIDGPGFAHHIFYVALGSRNSERNYFEATPSYRELGLAALAWLDGLHASNVEVKKIYFDGFLPAPKLNVRLDRLWGHTQQLSTFQTTNKVPCRASSPLPMDVRSNMFQRLTVRSKLTSLPPPSFLVPAVLEALLESPAYKHITEVIPGEADTYCAAYLKQYGGVVFTGDSDLLVHDLGVDGAVSFFSDIQNSSSAGECDLNSQVYHPTMIAERLNLPSSHGLPALAFEIFMDEYGTFQKLLQQAKSLIKVNTHSVEYDDFVKEYTTAITGHDPETKSTHCAVSILQSLDPRISEYVLQFPSLANIAGKLGTDMSRPVTAHVFLPFLVDSFMHRNAWEVSTTIRQLAYGLVNLNVPSNQQIKSVFEHKRQQIKGNSNGRELHIPGPSQISQACSTVLGSISKIRKSLPDVSESNIWTAFAINQDLDWSSENFKPCVTQLVMQQLSMKQTTSTGEQVITWDMIRFFAQIQGSYYSLRMLKQIMSLVVFLGPKPVIPEPMILLLHQLDTLPKLQNLEGLNKIPSMLEFIRLVSAMNSSRDKAASREPTSTNIKDSSTQTKKRQKTLDKHRSNPFELLDIE